MEGNKRLAKAIRYRGPMDKFDPTRAKAILAKKKASHTKAPPTWGEAANQTVKHVLRLCPRYNSGLPVDWFTLTPAHFQHME